MNSVATRKKEYRKRFVWDMSLDPPTKPAKLKEHLKGQHNQKAHAGEAFTIEGQLGGSTGAELARSTTDGKLYVRKEGGSPAHLREEDSADAVYDVMGISVPKHRIDETDEGPVKYTEFLPDAKDLPTAMRSADEAGRKKIREQLEDGFATDALLANWDVIGLEADNVLVTAGPNGPKVWRVDNGGALRYRAQGADKGAAFGDSVGETTRMRVEGGSNPNTGRAFKNVTDAQIASQVKKIDANRDAILAAVAPAVRSTLSARIDDMKRKFPSS